jgi:carboxyl-terminal processing protease
MSNTSTKIGGIFLVKMNRLLSVFLVLMLLLGAPVAVWATDTNPELLQEVRTLIQREFVRPVDQSILEKTDIKEIIQALDDPYSVYYTPEEYKTFLESTEQSFSGVGLQIEQVGDYVVVVAPIKNTPAQRAGLQSGDKILAVDGESVVGKSLEYVVSQIKGEEGTQVILTIHREGVPEPLIFLLIRENIQLEVVEYEMLDNNIGHIHLTTFAHQASRDFTTAVNVLKGKGMEALILDLRQNPGGYLSTALDIAANFADEGDVILYVAGRDGVEQSYQSLSAPINLPTVVLVDGGSASASEIVAGAIQDLGKGKLVGTQTFGKASVQTIFKLSNGGALKLTTAKYMTPKQQVINGIGLTPDYIVEDIDAQLAKGVELLKAELGIGNKKTSTLIRLNSPTARVGDLEVALDDKPLLVRGRVLLPVRLVAQALNSQVGWNQENKTAALTYKDQTLSLVPNERNALLDGSQFRLEVPAQLVKGRIYVPLRSICQAFGIDVYYNKALQEIQIQP